jgi:hypothetical protein
MDIVLCYEVGSGFSRIRNGLGLHDPDPAADPDPYEIFVDPEHSNTVHNIGQGLKN